MRTIPLAGGFGRRVEPQTGATLWRPWAPALPLARSNCGTPVPAPPAEGFRGPDRSAGAQNSISPGGQTARQQRLGKPPAALGRGPRASRLSLTGENPLELVFQPGRTNRRRVGGPIDHVPGRSRTRIQSTCPCLEPADNLWSSLDTARQPAAGRGNESWSYSLGPGPGHRVRLAADRSCRGPQVRGHRRPAHQRRPRA